MDAYAGEIRAFAGSFTPEGWLDCFGQAVPVQQYQLLFAVIGYTYGGTPGVNFKLPNLQGQVPMGFDPMLSMQDGTPTKTVTSLSMPSHSHRLRGINPVNATPAYSHTPDIQSLPTRPVTPGASVPGLHYAQFSWNTDTNHLQAMHGGMIGATCGTQSGGAAPLENRQPFLPMRFAICYDGTYPVRS